MSSLIASVAFAAYATPTLALEAKAIEGRWRSADERMVIDIGRCGQDYCGQWVNWQSANRPCEGTALNVKLEPSDTGSLNFRGKLDLGDKRGAYSVGVYVLADAKTMDVLGRIENTPMWGRQYPLDIQMVRIGDAACLPPPVN